MDQTPLQAAEAKLKEDFAKRQVDILAKLLERKQEIEAQIEHTEKATALSELRDYGYLP